MKVKYMNLNLFEMFDPMTSNNMMLNWLFFIYPMLLCPMLYYLIPSRFNLLWIKFLNYMLKEFNKINKYNSNMIIFLSLLIYIFFLNIFSLIPYIFSSTSHLIFNLTMSFTLWFGLMIYLILNKFKKFLIHLVPLNSPNYLMNFMVIIELISLLIRPMTLSIRLSANLIAGHLILILLSMFSMNFIEFYLISFLIQNLLLILEICMSFIQAYVFTVLMILYYSE